MLRKGCNRPEMAKGLLGGHSWYHAVLMLGSPPQHGQHELTSTRVDLCPGDMMAAQNPRLLCSRPPRQPHDELAKSKLRA
jgi:hypothetical protein